MVGNNHWEHSEQKRIKLMVYTLFSKNLLQCEFTLDVKSMLNENPGGILGGTQC